MHVKALAFDVFGTVVDWRGSLIEQFQAFGREKGRALAWETFVDEWRSAYRPSMEAVNNGTLPWTNLDTLYRAKLDALLEKYGLAGLSEAEKTRINHFWFRLNPWSDAVAGLARLKTKYMISTLSNGDVACMIGIAKHGGLPWDCILCAEIFRRYKPDPAVYLGAVQLLGCAPDDVMMVAAHNGDLHAARSHGMRTAFVPRPREYGSGQTSDLAPDSEWDIVAGDFAELARALGT
jgi:2-haloacid dehalogenase